MFAHCQYRNKSLVLIQSQWEAENINPSSKSGTMTSHWHMRNPVGRISLVVIREKKGSARRSPFK
jgi:hypothetical protein